MQPRAVGLVSTFRAIAVHDAARRFSPGMRNFFTKRQRALAGLPTEDEAPAPSPGRPPRCCDKARPEDCTCHAKGWRCPEHGYTGQDCNPRFTHD